MEDGHGVPSKAVQDLLVRSEFPQCEIIPDKKGEGKTTQILLEKYKPEIAQCKNSADYHLDGGDMYYLTSLNL
jgi:hypothetical protein